jgi:Sec-independent protein translocase protein TatA
MSFLGMGTLEILVILVLSFIFLGPERMVDAAKMLGKLVREGKKIASELPQVVMDGDDIKIINTDDDAPARSNRPARNPTPYYTPPEGAGEGQGVSEGPVSHEPSRPSPPIPGGPAPTEPPEEPPKT